MDIRYQGRYRLPSSLFSFEGQESFEGQVGDPVLKYLNTPPLSIGPKPCIRSETSRQN